MTLLSKNEDLKLDDIVDEYEIYIIEQLIWKLLMLKIYIYWF